MTDDTESKIVDLRTFKRTLRNNADDKTRDRTWRGLCEVWLSYADEVESRRVAGELCLSGEPTAVFSVLADELVNLAKALKIEDDDILETLLSVALIACEPKGRLYQLLNKASNLLEDGDEDSWENMLRAKHAAGEMTDDDLARELKLPE